MVQNFIFLIVLVHDLRKVRGRSLDSGGKKRKLVLTPISITKMNDLRINRVFIWLG
jgi:hypothetical protein